MASLVATVKGEDPAAGVARELRAMSDASLRAQRYADNNTKVRLRAATAGPLGPKVANAWRDRAYANDRALGPDSRSMVWTRAPNIIASAVEAPVIRAQGGAYLSIPLPAAGVGPGGRRITPAEFKRKAGIPLRVVRTKDGKLLLVAQAEGRALRRGKGGRLVGRQRGGGFAAKTFAAGKDYVVVFELVPLVRMKRLIDPVPIADQGALELADFLAVTLNAA